MQEEAVMSEISLDRGEDGDAQATRALRRIATALGMSATDFYGGSTTAVDLDDANEMMRIWRSLRHSSDRQKVLAFARAVAAESADEPKR